MLQKRAQQGDTVDLICWRHYGTTKGVVEAVYRANPGLAELGPTLPHGTLINLPEQHTASTVKTETIQLWS